jgi:hypothetical protein
MYRTTELANFARLANSQPNWPIRRFYKLVILFWCFGSLIGGLVSSLVVGLTLCMQILIKIES